MNMTLESLLDILDLEHPSQFEYFEHLAELMELNGPIPCPLFHAVLSEVAAPTLAELTDNYFEDILQGIPDNIIDIYTLLSAIRQNLFSLAQNSGNPDVRRQFADQLYQFKTWYTREGLVHCTRLDDSRITNVSVCEAFALYRLEKLNEAAYDYDFSDCLDYDLPEYTVSLGEPEFLDSPENWEEEEEALDGVVHPHHRHDDRHSRDWDSSRPDDESGSHGYGQNDWSCGQDHDHVHCHSQDCNCSDDPGRYGRSGSGQSHQSDLEDNPIDPYEEGLVDPEHPVMDDEFQDDAPSPEEEDFLRNH